VRISYDPEADAAYIYLTGQSDASSQSSTPSRAEQARRQIQRTAQQAR
jgi:uncharacterized protein YuzE